MKLVISTSGVYELPSEVVMKYLELKYKDDSSITIDHVFDDEGKYCRYGVATKEQEERIFQIYDIITKQDPFADEDTELMDDIQKEHLKLDRDTEFDPDDIERNDPILVNIIESGEFRYVDLKVVEIPDETNYKILSWLNDDYDSREYVIDLSSIWS